MTTTIHQVLGELRGTALDERDKGDKFERLIAAYLRHEIRSKLPLKRVRMLTATGI